jgi:hypothetical protein
MECQAIGDSPVIPDSEAFLAIRAEAGGIQTEALAHPHNRVCGGSQITDWNGIVSTSVGKNEPKQGRVRIMPNGHGDVRRSPVPPTDTEALIHNIISERLTELHAAFIARIVETNMPLPTVLFRLAPSNLMGIEAGCSEWRSSPTQTQNGKFGGPFIDV